MDSLKDKQENFTFKAHREKDVYAVNTICFNVKHGTFATGVNYYAKSFLIQKGSDGRICFWDKDARTRIKLIPDPKETSKVGYQKYKVVPVVDAAFNYNGK